MDSIAGLGGLPPGMGPGAAAAPQSKDDGKLVDLSPKIEKPGCYARNEDPGFPMSNLFIGDTRLGCKSDADEQLILHIAFDDFVRVKSIQFTEFNNGADPECHPSTVHVYANRDNLGFEDIQDVDPTQTFQLTAENLRESADPIATKYVKFQRIKSLTIFIEGNNGGEISALGALRFMGRPVDTTNMDDFKRNPDAI